MPDVRVALLPTRGAGAELKGRVAVVIDVLRATTTIIHALAAGAEAVIPCREVDEARAHQAAGRVLLGGERHGRLIEGFDLDNSPASYTATSIAGRTLAFTTTNGTRALAAAETADRVLIGAFANRQALVEELLRDGRPVALICAGTNGQVTAEDVLFAGAVADAILEPPRRGSGAPDVPDVESTPPAGEGDAVGLAVDFWQARGADEAGRLDVLRRSRGGRNLIEIGQSADIPRAAAIDQWAIVPEWRRATGRITVRDE
jgi:2-phosphosulfolactate phosphatase